MPEPTSARLDEQDALPVGATEQADVGAERAARASRGAQGARAHHGRRRRRFRFPIAAAQCWLRTARERLRPRHSHIVS